MQLPRTPSFRLDGRRALVTGGSRGLGLACACALAEAGAQVWVAARHGDDCTAVVEALRQRGDDAWALPLDVTDAAAVRAAVAAHGPFNVLVHSAGGNRPKLALDASDDDMRALLALNVESAFVTATAVAAGLKAAALPGSIVLVSSQMGHVGAARRSLYCATKHAVEGLRRALAWEWGVDGIRVNTLCPTFIETPMTHDWLAQPAFRSEVCAKIALGRVGEVEDVMGAVLFLASDASALITGSALMVDGGWTAA